MVERERYYYDSDCALAAFESCVNVLWAMITPPHRRAVSPVDALATCLRRIRLVHGQILEDAFDHLRDCPPASSGRA